MKNKLLLMLLFVSGVTLAQVSQDAPQGGDQDAPVQALTQLDANVYVQSFYSQFLTDNRPEIMETSNSRMVDIVFYTNRGEFEAESCDFQIEPFETNSGVLGCNEPVSSVLNNCYPAGQLIPGFEMTAEGTNGNLQPAMVLIGQGNFGVPSDCLGTNFFTSWMRLTFPNTSGNDEIYSVGWDFYEIFFNLANWRVDVYTTGNVLLGTGNFAGSGFFGVTSGDDPITRIDFYATPQNTNSVELVDNLTLGRACGGDFAHCVPSDCLIVTCPPDLTVACIEDYEIDAENASAIFNCTGDGGGGNEIDCTNLLLANTNMTFDCGGGNLYVCSGENLILSWTNASANPIVGGTIELDFGVNCSAGPRTVLLNGIPQAGTVDPLAQCTCSPVPSLFTITLNPANIIPNGLNTISIASNGTCLGLRDMGAGVYAEVCIETSGGGGGGGTVGTEAFRYVDQPHQTGASNCPGTIYEFVYHVGDNLGNVGCCTQTITIQNAPPTIAVPAGTTVSCYEDIVVSNDDATVNTSCGEAYELKILPPVVTGVHECPGTKYTYGYRVRDNCGREVIANRVFTIGSNPAPTIVAPPDMTISCDYHAEVNPAYAEVTTGCTLGYTTTVSGPTTTGSANCPGATYTYTYTVTDDCGRTASDTRKFTIANTAPVFTSCPSVPLIINCEDEGWEQVIQAWLASVQAESTCSSALNVTNNYNPSNQGLCINNGTRTVRWMATDACGRTSICEQLLIIADTEPPVFITPPQNELVVCNYITQDKLDAWVDANGYAEVEDCWANVTWSTFPNNPTINCGGNPGATSLTVTFVATDGCGNKSSRDATFTALPAQGLGGSSEGDVAEENLQLFQNQPNPFNDQTTISFYLPEATKATLSIYDVSGKLLKEIKGDYSAGMQVEEINRSDLQGAGMLYYKLSTDKETATQRMILLD